MVLKKREGGDEACDNSVPKGTADLVGGRAGGVVWMGGCAARPSPLSALNGAYLSGLPRLSAEKTRERRQLGGGFSNTV